jgi:hypothetical protein
MFRDDFIQRAGDVYRSHRSWSRLSSEDKYREFWSFFDLPDGNTASIYAGVPVRELLKRGTHSVEHIVPRTLLDFELRNAHKTLRRGASVNPLNFAASHQRANTHRGHAIFDFDEDKLTEPNRLDVHSIATQRTGMDHEGEWIVPPRTRGDIARSVLYMFLIYPLPRLRKKNAEALMKWAQGDHPSNWEKRYNQWVFERKGIQNPFIGTENKPMTTADDSTLFDALTKN